MRSEKIDTRTVLNGDMGTANLTNPGIRSYERERILAYWPEKILRPIAQGYVSAPPWRLLLDPTQWQDVEPEKVHDYVYRASLRGTWPSLDGLRRKFGRVSNHRSGGEVPGQEAML